MRLLEGAVALLLYEDGDHKKEMVMEEDEGGC